MTNLLKSAFLLLAVVFYSALGAQTAADGMTAMQMENWDKAISVYSAMAKANASDQSALLALGNAYLGKGDKAKAKETFKQAFDVKPEGAYALISNGRMLLLDNNTAEADKQFAKAAKAAKKDIDAQRAIGESYVYGPSRNLTRAEELLKTAYQFKTKDFATLMALGYVYKEMPNGGLAAQHYEFAQAIEPANPLAVYMQARVYRQAKLPEKYVDYMDRALKLDPKYAPALKGQAEYWYFTKRNYKKAADAYSNLLKNSNGATIEDEIQLANCHFLNKKYKDCTDLVEQIIKKDPSRNYLRRLLGYCYYEENEPQKSLDILTDYFQKVTNDKVLASDYEYLGKARIKSKGDTLVGIENLRKAIEMDTFSWPLYNEIGGLYYNQKKYCEAAKAYQSNMDSLAKPESADYFRLGNAYYYCKEEPMRFEKALKNYVKVTELSPDYLTGWLMCSRAASKLEPDIEQDPTQIANFGKARPYYEKYAALASADKEKNKKDITAAYEYLSYLFFKKGDAANFQGTIAKLLEIDPTNQTAIGLQQQPMPAPVGN